MGIDLSDKSVLVPQPKPLLDDMTAEELVDALLQAQGWRTCSFATAEQGQAWYARWEELRSLAIARMSDE